MRHTHLLPVCLLLVLGVAPPQGRAEDEEPEPPRGGRSTWDRLAPMDADGDGKVSRDEFQGPARLFGRLDADGDGFVTQAEAEAMRGRRGGRPDGVQGGRGGSDANAPAGVTLEMVDADRDGQISLAEWTSLFRTADCDGDGRVSATEWKQLLAPVTRPGGEAPAVGSQAPAVQAVPLAGGEAIDLAAPKRVTVLVFGSWT
jgi:Ca2+-binding EF-hand superfamily protein